jgi:hypothetical protein
VHARGFGVRDRIPACHDCPRNYDAATTAATSLA